MRGTTQIAILFHLLVHIQKQSSAGKVSLQSPTKLFKCALLSTAMSDRAALLFWQLLMLWSGNSLFLFNVIIEYKDLSVLCLHQETFIIDNLLISAFCLLNNKINFTGWLKLIPLCMCMYISNLWVLLSSHWQQLKISFVVFFIPFPLYKKMQCLKTKFTPDHYSTTERSSEGFSDWRSIETDGNSRF